MKVKTLEAIFFENTERENNFEVEKVGRKTSVIWNHKYSDSIHVDLNHTNSNKPIPENSTNIGSTNDSSDIFAMEKILLSPLYLVNTPSPLPAPRIFNYGTASDPISPSHKSLAESMTRKVNNTPHNKPPNLVPNIPDDPDSDPSFSDSSSLYSSDSSYDDYYNLSKSDQRLQTSYLQPYTYQR